MILYFQDWMGKVMVAVLPEDETVISVGADILRFLEQVEWVGSNGFAMLVMDETVFHRSRFLLL